MVSFSCEACNDTIKKPKLDQHASRCRGAQFTCLDCNTTFQGTEYRDHTSCISEAQKLFKGDKKANTQQQKKDAHVVVPAKDESVKTNGSAATVEAGPSAAPAVPAIGVPATTSTDDKADKKKEKDKKKKEKKDKKRKRESGEGEADVSAPVADNDAMKVDEPAVNGEATKEEPASKKTKTTDEKTTQEVEASPKSKKDKKKEKKEKKKKEKEAATIPSKGETDKSKAVDLPALLATIVPSLLEQPQTITALRKATVEKVKSEGFKGDNVESQVEKLLNEKLSFSKNAVEYKA